MSIFSFIILLTFSLGVWPAAYAQSTPEVEWYPPETEKSRVPGQSKVMISGRTLRGSLIQVDGDSVTILDSTSPTAETLRKLRIHCKVYAAPAVGSKIIASLKKGRTVKAIKSEGGWVQIKSNKDKGFISQPCLFPINESSNTAMKKSSKIESRSVQSNFDGFFEIAMDLPEGLAQIPISVTGPKNVQKTFMISVNVVIKEDDVDDIKINTSTSRAKPPAAGKKIRLWLGAGPTYQKDSQKTTGAQDLSFQTVQIPGVFARGGYWGEQWGLDFYFREAPGKITTEAPLQAMSDTYHWQTMEAKGLYQFARGPGSRLAGLPSQWQLRFGASLQQVPFFEISDLNVVKIDQSGLTMGTLGVGLLLGQEQDWTYEFAVGIQHALSASGPGSSFATTSPFGYDAQIGAAYKFAPNWRIGVFSYTQSLQYNYTYQNAGGVAKSGSQNLFYTTFDLRLGYEF